MHEAFARFVYILPDGCQRGCHVRRKWNIVETDYRDVTWELVPMVLKCPHGPDRDYISYGKNCVKRLLARK